MPTFNRRKYIPRAILYFLRQTYENKELLIVDDGDEDLQQLIPENHQIRYLQIPHSFTLGEKRNLCVRQSKGDLIMHWDDDDWMAPHRIEYQVRELLENNSQVCGSDKLYYHAPSQGQSWLYQYPSKTNKPWLAGGSLLYTKDFWAESPFPNVQVASDTAFIFARELTSYTILPYFDFYLATIHGNNTSPKQTSHSIWQPINTEILRSLLKEDWEAYVQPELLLPQESDDPAPIEESSPTKAAPTTPPGPADISDETQGSDFTTSRPVPNHQPFPHLAIYQWGDQEEDKPSVTIMITTYKRADLLNALLLSLKQEEQRYSLTVIVLDDEILGNGKRGYWKSINILWEEAKEIKTDYYIQMPDDIGLTDNFIEKAIHQWNHLLHPHKICLNLLLDSHRIGKTVWTNTWPKLHVFEEQRYLRTQWVDMFFICENAFFDSLNWKIGAIPRQRWASNPNLSSGVGNQISERLHKQQKSLYQVTESLVTHLGEESMMNPKVRQTEPLVAIHLPKIYAGMATIPSREKILRNAIKSIIQQVDRLFLFFNEYETIPEWIKDYGKIVPFRSQEENTNMGDAGKFFGLNAISEEDYYYFSLDDDCAYPENYVWHMINKIEKYQQKVVVGCGGYIMKPTVKHFYSDRESSWHINSRNTQDRPVHILHTCLTAWHRSALNFQYSDCHTANMGDIWLGIEAQKQKTPMILIDRPAGWVKIQPIPIEKTIYGQFHKNDQSQTDSFNTLSNWKIHPFASS